MVKISKYRDYFVKWYIRSSKEIVTEVYRSGIKLDIQLPLVETGPEFLIGKRDIRNPLRRIYVLNSPED